VGIEGSIGGSRDDRAERIEAVGGPEEIRPVAASWVLGTGTLACPSCDAPVYPTTRPMGPADDLECPVCAHPGAVRDFLSLAEPTRPTRVVVRLVPRLLPA